MVGFIYRRFIADFSILYHTEHYRLPGLPCFSAIMLRRCDSSKYYKHEDRDGGMNLSDSESGQAMKVALPGEDTLGFLFRALKVRVDK